MNFLRSSPENWHLLLLCLSDSEVRIHRFFSPLAICMTKSSPKTTLTSRAICVLSDVEKCLLQSTDVAVVQMRREGMNWWWPFHITMLTFRLKVRWSLQLQKWNRDISELAKKENFDGLKISLFNRHISQLLFPQIKWYHACSSAKTDLCNILLCERK